MIMISQYGILIACGTVLVTSDALNLPEHVQGMMPMSWELEMGAPSLDGQGVDMMGKHSL